MKYTSCILLLCSIILVSCNNRPAPPPFTPEDEDPDTSTVPSPKPSPKDSSISQQVYYIWSYEPQFITIPAQTTMEHVVYDIYPNMRRCYNYENVGGIKLIGEMSADRAGYNYSYYPYSIAFDILSLPQLHLKFISSRNNVIYHAIDGNIKIESAKITTESFCVEIYVRNISPICQEIEFEQGQMIEVNEPHVQNVVLTSKAKAQLEPNESRRFTIPVFCVAHHRDTPTGYPARITPYIMNAPSTTFQSQQRVWNFLESNDDPNSYVTFFVWGKGTITDSGRTSPTGHAFVRIPQVGVLGFSSLHGGLLNDEGRIYDHTSSIQYATDSCRIKVSDEAKKAMTAKVRQLQQDVPNYKIGRYDCTSFVMDIADAGRIHYGTRILIQTPVGFMQELKKHNYSY